MSKRILIVDDEKNIRMTLKHCLRAEKYNLDIAINGDEALTKIKSNEYDLVLLDIKMPGLSGMEVLKKVRERGNDTNIIMMTAYGTIERAVEAMKLNAIDFISKPFSPEEIRSIVKDVLRREDLVEDDLDNFKDIIQFSKKCILDKKYDKAKEYLKKAIVMDEESPEPYNMIGVLYEYERDIDNAQKNYRIALAIDPSYKPADINLERTVQFNYSEKGIKLDEESLKEDEK
ncbi:MAG TPA: response regulator [Clostridiales bacterium]|jgi:DNA-binding response OmpR family regulator|nr:response regulator [Clostridiales bacterium]